MDRNNAGCNVESNFSMTDLHQKVINFFTITGADSPLGTCMTLIYELDELLRLCALQLSFKKVAKNVQSAKFRKQVLQSVLEYMKSFVKLILPSALGDLYFSSDAIPAEVRMSRLHYIVTLYIADMQYVIEILLANLFTLLDSTLEALQFDLQNVYSVLSYHFT